MTPHISCLLSKNPERISGKSRKPRTEFAAQGERTKALVVLGNRLRGNGLPDELKGRLDLALSLLDKMEIGLVIPTGGWTNPEIYMSESAAMAEYLITSGVEPGKILLEEKAKETIGNAIFSRIALCGYADCSEVVVVTSCYHVQRSRFIFENVFGSEYSLDFSQCAGQHLSRNDEASSMQRAVNFFSGLDPGDFETALEKLMKTPLYSNNPPA